MKNRKTILLISFAVIIALLLVSDLSFAQCSMCQKIATDGANTKTAGKSLNGAILYLLAAPYCLLAFFFRKQLTSFFRQLISK